MCIEEKSDELLVKEFIQGNQKSFNVLLNRHKDKIYSYIYYLVKDSEVSNDIFQDAFFKVIQKIKSGKYNEEGKFINWVMRICHNLAIDFFRKNKKMSIIDNKDDSYDVFEYINVYDPSVEDVLIENQISNNIRRLVEQLPPEQKEIVIMRHYMDMSFKDIADRTNVSINTALGRMRYAVINLRKLIKNKESILMK